MIETLRIVGYIVAGVHALLGVVGVTSWTEGNGKWVFVTLELLTAVVMFGMAVRF